MSDRISFGAIPYVKSENLGVIIGDFILWPNTAENWVKYTGRDWTAHMEQYHDRQDAPVGENGSVLTHKDLAKPISREEFRDVVASLSTAAWLLDHPIADAWLLETWDLAAKYNPNEDVYTRSGKFQLNWNSPEYDILRPNPYMRSIKFNPVGDPGSINYAVLHFVTGELLKKREESLLTAMHRFHRIRQATPYYNSAGDDLEGLWSGFESLFKAPKHTQNASGNPQERWEWVLDRIKDEFSPEAAFLNAEFWEGLRQWAEKLYISRSMYTHGSPDVVTDIKLTPNGHSLYGIGLLLAQTIFEFRAYKRTPGHEYCLGRTMEILNAQFSDYPLADKVITYLKKNDRKTLMKGKIPADMCDAMIKLAYNDRDIGAYESPGKLFDALQTINLTLSEFAKQISGIGLDASNGYILALMQFPSELEKAVERVKQARGANEVKGYTNEEKLSIKDSMAEYIEKSNLHKPHMYHYKNPSTLEKLKITPNIGLWTLASLYIRLHKMLPDRQ